jgi:integrase
MGRLTVPAIESAKARETLYKLPDGDGLVLWVYPNGSKLWRFRYRYGGRENMVSVGRYPEVELKAARSKALDFRRALIDGRDPAEEKRAEKFAQADSFRAVAEEWLKQQRTGFSAKTMSSAEGRLKRWVYPKLGNWSISDIEPPDVLRVLRPIEGLGKHETAHRVRNRISQVFRYAIATGRASRDPTADLRGALSPVPTENRAALTKPADVGGLLRAIDSYQGQPAVMHALRLAPLVFVRPGELRAAEWAEFELDGKTPEWRIPKEKTKMRTEHVVPLSTQASAILEELREHTGHGKFLFPSLRSRDRCMSDNTLNAALRRMGYDKTQQTAHGLRSTASTLLNELGWHPDLIELQLAHKPRDKVRAAYNKAERLADRRKMMQAWADYLEGLRSGAKVVAIGSDG